MDTKRVPRTNPPTTKLPKPSSESRYGRRRPTSAKTAGPTRRIRVTEPSRIARGPAGSSAHSQGDRPRLVLLRSELGGVLRDTRQRQGRTLRDVSAAARVSLGYLSEVERGQKEASSELLSSICEALDIPLCDALREVVDRITLIESGPIPDSIPNNFVDAKRELVAAS